MHTVDAGILVSDVVEEEEGLMKDGRMMIGDLVEVSHQASGGVAKHHQSENLFTAEEEEVPVVALEDQMAAGMGGEGDHGDSSKINTLHECR